MRHLALWFYNQAQNEAGHHMNVHCGFATGKFRAASPPENEHPRHPRYVETAFFEGDPPMKITRWTITLEGIWCTN